MREVDCTYVTERVQQLLDGELSEREADELRQHIDACAHCLDETDLFDALRKLVRRAFPCPTAPDTLRLRVVAQIHTVSFTFTDPGTGPADAVDLF